jgi:hypothetical protein
MKIPDFSVEKLIEILLPQKWQKECEIIPDYMPPFPGPETKPKVVVRYPNPHEDTFLRYLESPLYEYFWDIYGDDLFSVEVAIIALSRAPIPLNYRKAEYPIKFKL